MLMQTISPLFRLLPGFVLGSSIALLDLTGQLAPVSFDDGHAAVSKIGPFLLNKPDEWLEVTFYAIQVHFVKLWICP
jgi:hypothetical protein